MKFTPEQIEAARHVLWHCGDFTNGCEPGSFTKALLDAWGKADWKNQLRLKASFPELGEAIVLAQYSKTGIDELQGRVKAS